MKQDKWSTEVRTLNIIQKIKVFIVVLRIVAPIRIFLLLSTASCMLYLLNKKYYHKDLVMSFSLHITILLEFYSVMNSKFSILKKDFKFHNQCWS